MFEKKQEEKTIDQTASLTEKLDFMMKKMQEQKDNFFEEIDMTPLELDNFMNDRNNFSDEEWEERQRQKQLIKELVDNLKSNEASSPLRHVCNSWFK